MRVMKNHREYDMSSSVSDTSTAATRVKGALIISSFANIFFLSLSGTTTSALFVGAYILPVLIFVDWLLFDEKGIYTIRDVLLWLFIPVVYYLYVILFAQIGIVYSNNTHYPYSFMDSSVIGFSTVIKNMIVFVLLFFVLGALLLLSDTLLNAYGHKLNKQMQELDDDTENQPVNYEKNWYTAEDFSNGIAIGSSANTINATEKAELKKVIETETSNSSSPALFSEKEFPLLAELNILAKLKMPTEKNEKVTIESLFAAINNVAQADGIDLSSQKTNAFSNRKAAILPTSEASTTIHSSERDGMPSASKIPEMNAVPIRIKNKPYTAAAYPSMSTSDLIRNSIVEPATEPPVVSYVESDKPIFDSHEAFSGVPLTTLTTLPAVKPISQFDNPNDYARCYAIPIQSSVEIAPSTTATTFGSTALSGPESSSARDALEPEFDNEPHRPSYYANN